jgi:hypothetical protein
VLEHPTYERRAGSAPNLSLLKRPRVDRAAVAHQLQQAWFTEFLGGPSVQALQPRHDDGVVEYPAKSLLIRNVAVDVERERIAAWEHAAE